MKTSKKIAFITGANRGIGLETARQLGKEGIVVVLGSRQAEKGKAAAAALRVEGIAAEAFQFDAVRAEDHRAAFDYLEEVHGKLDILVNNAAIAGPDDAEAGQASTSSPWVLRQTFETNFFSVVGLTQTLLPLLRKSPAGRIVNLSSKLGSLTLHSDPASSIYNMKTLAYDASKTALNVFTVHLAHELKETPIKVNSVHPGWVKSGLGGPNAHLDVSEGAKTSVELATLAADGPTGGFFHMGQPLPW